MNINVNPKTDRNNAISEMQNKILKIKYSNGINKNNWKKVADNDFQNIRGSIPVNDNIYAIMVKVNIKTQTAIVDKKNNYYEVRYIGKSSDIRKRLRSHLVYKSKETSSCLENVKKHILGSSKKELYITTIQVIPHELNSYVESLLLNHFYGGNVWYTRTS